MTDARAIEREMLEVLRAPDRYERPLDNVARPEDLIRQALLDSYSLARQAWSVVRPMAVSYRGCYVVTGARLLVPGFGALKAVDAFGYNVKLAGGDIPNIHAEELVLHQARHLGALTLNIVVVGEPQPDNSIHENDPVLAPCDYRCTPKIVSDASVGTYSMTTCVNPLTGATQFITHDMLTARNWDAIPLIETTDLNDHEEWLEKAGPVIDSIITPERQDCLAEMIEQKRKLQTRVLVDMMIRGMQQREDSTHFFALSSTGVSDLQSSVQPDLTLPAIHTPIQLEIPVSAIEGSPESSSF